MPLYQQLKAPALQRIDGLGEDGVVDGREDRAQGAAAAQLHRAPPNEPGCRCENGS